MEIVIDDAVLLKFTGQKQVRDPDIARRRMEKAGSKCKFIEQEIQSLRQQRAMCWWKLAPIRIAQPWVWALITGSVVATAASLISILAGTAEAALLIIWILGSYLFVGLPVFFFLADLRHPVSLDVEHHRTNQLAALDFQIREKETDLGEVRQAFERCKILYDGIVAARDSRINLLLQSNYHAMEGWQFEEFLADVFRHLGCRVEETGKSGDQGVDLVVTSNQTRIAVQAKCYGGSVGNAAVQQAMAGKVFYGCHRCAVITNSEFTRSAYELAEVGDCVLIDGNALPSLIRGMLQV